MRLGDFMRDRAGMLLLNGAGALFLTVFLLAAGNSVSTVALILIAWCLILSFYFCICFVNRRKYFREVQKIFDELDQRYLLGEMMPSSWRMEDTIYREFLQKSNKSVIEKIHQMEDEQREYKEYIESWIHEAKTPITGMNLICEHLLQNIQGSESAEWQQEQKKLVRRLQTELGRMENQVEMVLYHARMERAYQDYLIVRTDLRKVVVHAIQKNRLYFMENQMQIDLEMDEVFVSTDEKWVLFLLNQIFSNAVKYRRESGARVRIYTERREKKVSLFVEDNGCGIRPEEIGRVFQKGFCGTNGRKNQYATGMGLYLCRRLCEKLEIGIQVRSEVNAYTKIILTFPDSDFYKCGESSAQIFQK